MAHTENCTDSRADVQGKNADIIYCTYCPSKILNAGVATLTNIEYSLPYMQCKRDEIEKRESIDEYWLVEDINNFENIGVSHKVENVKFLVCADCERGPVGWHDLCTLRSYIAPCRVKHQKSTS